MTISIKLYANILFYFSLFLFFFSFQKAKEHQKVYPLVLTSDLVEETVYADTGNVQELWAKELKKAAKVLIGKSGE